MAKKLILHGMGVGKGRRLSGLIRGVVAAGLHFLAGLKEGGRMVVGETNIDIVMSVNH